MQNKNNEQKDVFEDEYVYDKYNIKFIINSQETRHTEKGYENLYKLDINITTEDSEYIYNDYYIIVDDIKTKVPTAIIKEIFKNIYDITFNKAKFIGEVKKENDKIILAENKYIVDELKNTDSIMSIYEEYKTIKNSDLKLKYEAFFEVYFATHQIPDGIKRDYINEGELFNISKLDEVVRDSLRGKAHKLSDKIEELNSSNNINVEIHKNKRKTRNRIIICEQLLLQINNFKARKNSHSILLVKAKELREKKKKTPFYRFAVHKDINEQLKDSVSDFDYNVELDALQGQVFLKTKNDIIEHFNSVKEDELEREIKKYLEKLNQEMDEIINNELMNKDQQEKVDNLYFDDLYEKLDEKNTENIKKR